MIKIKFDKNRVIILIIFLIFYCNIFIFYYLFGQSKNITNTELFLISWISNIVFIITSYFVYILDRKKIGLSNIVLIFGFLFNFGQMFLWSIGIHPENEIGAVRLFSNFSVPTNSEIYSTIFYSIICYVSMALGIILGNIFFVDKSIYDSDESISQYIYIVSSILGIVVIPLTFVKVILTLRYSSVYGYADIYYSDFQIPAIFDFAERLFFPVLVGVLYGGKYKKVKLVYSIFGAFTILYTLAGERGNWIYDLVILVWMHYRYYCKINFRKMLTYIVAGIVALYLLSVIVDLRDVGLFNITISDFMSKLQFRNNPVIRFICEMGNSLGVTLMVCSLGRDSFPPGNTFLSSLLGATSSKLADFFNLKYQYLSNYLSQDLLQISYGTGFNFFAESYINGSVIYLVLFGVLIALFLRGSNSDINSNSSFRTFIMLIITPTFCSCFRQESLSVFKSIVQIGLLYPLLLWMIYKLLQKRKKG